MKTQTPNRPIPLPYRASLVLWDSVRHPEHDRRCHQLADRRWVRRGVHGVRVDSGPLGPRGGRCVSSFSASQFSPPVLMLRLHAKHQPSATPTSSSLVTTVSGTNCGVRSIRARVTRISRRQAGRAPPNRHGGLSRTRFSQNPNASLLRIAAVFVSYTPCPLAPATASLPDATRWSPRVTAVRNMTASAGALHPNAATGPHGDQRAIGTSPTSHCAVAATHAT